MSARPNAIEVNEPPAEALGVQSEAPDPPQQEAAPEIHTRSGRAIRKPQSHQDFVAYQAINQWHKEDEMEDKQADSDMMYLHEAMRQPDKAEFLKAMEKEMADHMPIGS